MTVRALTRVWKFQAGRGLDVGVFGLGSYFAFLAPKRGSNPMDYVYESRWAGAIMLAAWAAQGVGAWLKRAPLQRRLAERAAEPGFRSPLQTAETQIFIFTGWHAIISGILFFAGMPNLFPELRALNDKTDWWVVLLMIGGAAVCLVPTVLTWLALRPLGDPKLPAWRSGHAAEVLADQLLIFSYLVLSTTILGTSAMLEATRPLRPDSLLIWAVVLLVVVPMLWVALVWLFLPFRMLLMIEELGTWRSRLSFFISLVPLMAQYIVG